MGEWKAYTLGDIVIFKNGKSRPAAEGAIPIYGGNGILGYTNKFNSENEVIVIGRVGAYCGSVYFENKPIWISDNALFGLPQKDNDTMFLFYFLKNLNLNNFAEGSSHPLLTQTLLNSVDIQITDDIHEQKSIASILSCLDDKIDLLHRQNKTLEALAETLFRQWFVEEAKDGWEMGKLGNVISIYDSKRIPVSSMEREKMKIGELYPYYGAATLMDYVNEYIFDGEYILMGEDGTVQTENGYPILQMATGKFWVNNHAHVFQAVKPYSNFLIYIFLKQTNILHIVTGAVQPKINQENLKSIEFPLPPDEKVNEFVLLTNSYWEKIKKNNDQIRTLTRLRDTLLPKLMSGEVRVEL